MIILLSTDENVINGAKELHTLFQNEIALRFEQITDANYDLSLSSETPIRRLTILGHTRPGLYGGMNADSFVEHITHILETNEQASPGFIENLEAIDLVGCELGFVGATQESFALQVAERLLSKGYRVPIHAFTDKREHKDKYYNTITQNNPANDFEATPSHAWEFLGFKTKADKQYFRACHKQANQIYDQKNEKTTALYELIETERTLKSQNVEIEKGIIHSRQKMKTIKENMQTPEQKRAFAELVVEWKQGIATRKTQIADNRQKIQRLLQTQAQISEEIEKLEKEQQSIEEQSQSYFTVIGKTNNPRDYFAEHPECNFTQLAQKKNGITGLADALLKQKTNQEEKLKAITDQLQGLEAQNTKLQKAISAADSIMEMKQGLPRSVEEEDAFTELEQQWREGVEKRQTKILENTLLIHELLQTQQLISIEIGKIDRKLEKMPYTQSLSEVAPNPKSNTVQITREYKAKGTLGREKVSPEQQPLPTDFKSRTFGGGE